MLFEAKYMGRRVEEHSFSIEMTSERSVRRMSFLDENGHVFFEGFLGELKNISIVEGVMLEIEGRNGVLKLDITQRDMEKCLAEKNASKHEGEQ
jgi:hypothetical protein